MSKEKVANPNKIGIGKFWAWQSRGYSLAASVIIFTYLNLFCTDVLHLAPGLVGTLLLVSKVFDGVTDLFAGYLIDNTNTKWGKARPYEFAIFGVWLCTWLLFSCPAEASTFVKGLWVFLLYTAANSIFATLLNASAQAYTVRAFTNKIQIAKVSSFGGIVITLGCVIVSVSFPILMASIATTAAGWSKLVAVYAIPLAFIGILRFIFVKETVQVEEQQEKIKAKELVVMLKNNRHLYPIIIISFISQLIGGINVISYYFKYIVGNLQMLGIFNMLALPTLLIMVIFPILMKKLTVSQIISGGALFGAAGGVLAFFAGANIPLLVVAYLMTSTATLAPAYLTGLMLLDCATYNTYKGYSRMDATLGAVNNFTFKVGGGVGTGLLGVLLGAAGYSGTAAVQSGTALTMIRGIYGLVPAIGWLLVFVTMRFYKLDKELAQLEAKEAE